MKRFFLYIAAAVCLMSCNNKDTLWMTSVVDLDSRVSYLEQLCIQMNTNIESLQTIITALQERDYVTNVAEIKEGDEVIGYTITFAINPSITIYKGNDGKDGKDGKDGVDGKDGKDGATPQIGVAKDGDIYYWTLNGEWLLDAQGNKIRVTGENGKDGQDGINGQDGQDGQNGQDGITPQLKIENDYWYISYNNGATWTQLGKATGADGKDGQDGKNGKDGKDGADGQDGADGDSMFKSVTQDDNYVYFTLADGSVFKVNKLGSNIDQIVIDNLVNSLTLNKTSCDLLIGETETLIATTTPFANSKVTWSSNNTDVVIVNNGTLTPIEPGIATITAMAGSRLATCKVNVLYSLYYFSVSAKNAVAISPGNLQYQPSSNTWRFAENQWDYRGTENNTSNMNASYSGWIDLFVFGTSGWDNGTDLYMPYHYKRNYNGPETQIAEFSTGSQSDWGVHNAISNAENKINRWRTPTLAEWRYLLDERDPNLRFFALVNSTFGLVILPDNWQLPSGMTTPIINVGVNQSYPYNPENVYTQSQWQIMENAGAIFLPAAGLVELNYGSNVDKINKNGAYWTNTISPLKIQKAIDASPRHNYFNNNSPIYGGSRCSVRLVKDVKQK